MIRNMYMILPVIGLLIVMTSFENCDIYNNTSNEYKIIFFIVCTGGTSQNFSSIITWNDGIDDYLYRISETGEFCYYLENITSISISATKANGDSAIAIYIFKDDELVQDASLEGNYPSAASPSNTITTEYIVDDETDESSTSDDEE